MTYKKQLPEQDLALIGVGKLTPQNIEMEEAILGAIMINSEAVSEVIDTVTPNMFYKESNQFIYNTIYELYKGSEPIDLLTVTNHLRKNKQLEAVGGPSYIASLTHRVASAANIDYHAKIVMEKYVLRTLISTCNTVIKDSFESNDITEIMALVDNLIDNVSKVIYSKNEIKHVSKVIERVEADLQKRIEFFAEGKMPGITTGLKTLDQMTKGWQKGNLIIEAGRPGMGKTAVSLKHAISAAKAGFSVCIFSMEMSDIRLVDRLIIGLTGINPDHYREGNITQGEMLLINKAKEILQSLPIYIDDNPVCTTSYVRNCCKRMKAKGQCDLIIIDYLQLTDVQTGTNKQYNREQQITKVSRDYKVTAKEIDVPLILLCQLSRAVETRGSKKPQLSDLRESGSIEQDADVVVFLYRPEYYGEEGHTVNDERGNFLYGVGYLVIAKQREGPLVDVSFSYNRSLTQIWDKDERDSKLPNSGQTIVVPLQTPIPNNTSFEQPDPQQEFNYDLPY